MKNQLIAAFTWFAFTLPMSLAADEAKVPEKLPDFETVRQADRFAIGGIGIAGTKSRSELALRNILKSDTADVTCQKLVAKGTIAGQLYGLLGLKLLQSDAYKSVAPRYLDSKEMVPTAAGCIFGEEIVASVAQRINKGDYK